MIKKFTYKKKLKSPQTVGEIIRECSQIADTDGLPVMYRTFGPDGEDILAGYCRHKRGFLVPEDHDIYSMNDKIIQYQVTSDDNGKPFLIVWYQSEWVGGCT